MENLKKYWWLVLLLPVVIYMVYIMGKETNGKPKPGSPEYARQAKADKALLKETETQPDGGDSSQDQSVNA